MSFHSFSSENTPNLQFLGGTREWQDRWKSQSSEHKVECVPECVTETYT